MDIPHFILLFNNYIIRLGILLWEVVQMPKIFSPEELGEINNTMLHRGAPDEKDDFGYNQPDYITCKNILGIPDKAQCYTLSQVFIKYCNTQLNIPIEDMKATGQYYSKYASGKYVKPLNHDNVGVWVSWGYNPKLNDVVKEIGRPIWDAYKFEKRSDQGVVLWACRIGLHCMDDMLKAMENAGANVDDVRAYVAALPVKEVKEQPKETAIIANNEVTKITVKRLDTDRLSLKFDRNDFIRLAIKALPQWKFYKGDKDRNPDPHWEIDLDDADTLYQKLKDNKMIDCSELGYWAARMRPTMPVQLKDFSYLKRQPRPSQIEGATEMLAKKREICGDEMGVGKTFECIMVGESIPMPKLVICPPSLRLNWQKEIRMVNPQADIQVIYSDTEFKQGKDWTIIGYSSLSDHKDMIEECEFRVLFVDEAHFTKAINNSGRPDSQRAEIVQFIAKTCEYTIPMTGTPKPNRNKDLFNLLRMIKHPLAKYWNSWHNYAHTYCGAKYNGFGWDFDGNSKDEELHEELKPYMLRRLKKDVLPNIKKIRTFLPVQVDLREYNRIIDEYMEEYHKRKGTVAEQLARINRARLVLGIAKAQASIEYTKDLLEEGKKVVVISNFTEVVTRFKKAFGDKAVTVVGGMTDADKQAAVDRFQEGDAEVCVCNIIAGGVGITLTASYNVVINDYNWVPGNHIQAEDRVARGGQVQEYSNMYYMYAVGADMDEMFTEVLQYKLDTINATIDGGTAEDIDLQELVREMLNSKASGKTFTATVEKYTAPTKPESKPKSDGKSTVAKEVEKPATEIRARTECPSDKEIKKMTNDEIFAWAKAIGAEWKACDHAPINRMRAIMSIKKTLQV